MVNPAAGNGATGRRWPVVQERLDAAGLRGESLFSERPRQLGELACDAVRGGAARLVVVGGDGTVHEVADGLLQAGLGRDVELALLPFGTGQDVARSLSVPRRLGAAIEVARSGRLREIDAGRATYTTPGGEATAHFVNFAGAGISGEIAHRANRTTKALGGRLSFLWATVAVFSRWQPTAMTLSIDGEERRARLHEALAMNGGYAAGGMLISPGASTEDGFLDAVLLGDFTKPEFVLTFPKIYRGRHVSHPKVEILRGRELRVTSAAPLPVVLDGEQPGTTPARFEVVPRALRFRTA